MSKARSSSFASASLTAAAIGVALLCSFSMRPALALDVPFGPRQTISAAADGAQSVFAADVDGDGDLDALSASYSDHKIAWYENDGTPGGTGDWVAHTIVIAASGANTVYAADVDGDGDVDALSTFGSGTVAWYENTAGDGTNWTEHTITTAVAGPYSVFAADVDGDGDLDALSASMDDATIAWYENTAGDGTAWTPHTITTAADWAISVFAADVDGDGDLDALSAEDGIAWHENTAGDGTTWTVHTITTAVYGDVSVFAADVDGDGDLDALSASINEGTIAWHENTAGDGTAWTPHTITTAADGAMSVFAADVDGDGDLDVLSASGNDDTIAWYENGETLLRDSTIGEARTITTAADWADFVFTADIDRDGDLDVLSSSWYGNTIAWYENTDGSGSMGPVQVISDTAVGARSVVAADVDGDGDLDALSACQHEDTVAWYENDGTPGGLGDWTEYEISTAADAVMSVYAADVDGDGDLDALSASYNDDKIAWYENDGTPGGAGDWVAHTISTGADRAMFVYAADVDGDGDLDVLSASENDDKIAWYANASGDGSAWTPHTITTAADGARSVFAADVDGDGDLDVLSASDFDNTIAWYENDGTPGGLGDWTEHPISTTAAGARSVFATDVDADGDLDVLSASAGDDTVAWYVNTMGDGSAWDKLTITTAADGALCVRAADMDGDGDPDVLSASTNDDTVAWYPNRRTIFVFDETDWAGMVGSTQGLDTTAANVGLADELATPPVADEDIGSTLTFDGANTGLCWTFRLGTLETGSQFTFDDDEGTSAWDEALSVGDIDDYQDDDFEFEFLNGPPLRGFGFYLLDNAADPGESYTIHGADGQPLGVAPGAEIPDSSGHQTTFVGVITAEQDPPAERVVFDESSDGDDIGILDFRFREDTLTDSDSDGLSDCEEVGIGTDPLDADTDDDGVNDADDTDPLDPYVCGDEDADTCDDCASGTVDPLNDGTDVDSDGFCAAGDCDDGNAAVHPGAEEVCDGVNNDCDHPEWPALGGLSWTRHTIATDGSHPVFAADLDDDGDLDVLSGATWYENTDGVGGFGSPQVLGSVSVDSVFAASISSFVSYARTVDVIVGGTGHVTGYFHRFDGSSWLPQVIDSAGDLYVESIFAAELNGDYRPDILVGGGYRVLWYEQPLSWPDSEWNQHVITAAVRATSVFAADIDGDGDMDALWGAPALGTGRVGWHENLTGDGLSWVEHPIADDTGGMQRSVFAADVDGDRDLDVLSASAYDDTVAWYENTAGDGSAWTTHVITTAADFAFAVYAADVDGDGDVDALSASRDDDTIAWYENTAGDGTAWTEHAITTSADLAGGLFAVDLDGDGDVDVLSSENGGVAWYENIAWDSDEFDGDGDGLSECAGDCDDGNATCTGDCTDADGDGYCAGVDCDEGNPYCTGDCTDTDGDGSCTGADCSDIDPNNWVSCLTCADGDGDLDLVAGNTSNPDRLYLNDGNGVFGPGSDITSDAFATRSVALGDVDGDGDLDLVEGNQNQPDRLYLNDGTGAFGPGSDITSDAFATRSVALGDVDRDGDLDLVAGGYPNRLYLNDGTGAFGPGSDITSDLFDTRSVALGDLDGDGDLDLVAGNGYTQGARNRLYLNNGTADPWAGVTGSDISVDTFCTASVVLGDVDGDGDLDLVTGEGWGWNVCGATANRFYRNDGTGGFDAVSTLPGDTYFTASVVLGDVDGDGDLDLVAGNALDQPNRLYLNDGNGVFGPGSDITSDLLDTHSVALGDVDGDGDLDLVTGNMSDPDRLYLNDGNGVFGPGSDIASDALSTQSVVLGDVDGDGDGFYTGCDAYGTIPEDCDVANPNCTGDCTDADSDDYCVTHDCDETDGQLWSIPGEVWDLIFLGDKQTLSWSAPLEPGCVSPLYDTIRSSASNDFLAAGYCVESDDDTDTQAVDAAPISSGTVYYYLVTAENACGRGTAGWEWGGTERQATECP